MRVDSMAARASNASCVGEETFDGEVAYLFVFLVELAERTPAFPC